MTISSDKSKQNLETFSLIWLDAIVNESADNIETQKHLRTFINHLKTFEHVDDCVKYIKSLPNDRFVLIVSGRLGQEIVSHIHNLRQVYSIYIYCLDKERNERWAKHYSKIRSVIIDLNDLVLHIRSNQEQRLQTQINEPLPITFFYTNKQSDEYNNDFIYSQLLIDYLIHIKPNATDENEFLTLCKNEYKGNDHELNIINEFERNYSSDRAIWWFTRNIFIYRLLNKAFRIQNIDLLFTLRFFICDIQRLIEQNKCTYTLCVYRAYLMSNEELQLFKNSIGEFISINGFFTANMNRQQTISYLNNPDITNDNEKVLFEITTDPNVDSNKPFCNITPLSYYSSDEQILFTLGSIFRLVNIYEREEEKNHIWIIRMKLSTNKHKRLIHFYEELKHQYNSEQLNLLSFGKILRKMRKYDDAEKFYCRLLKELPHGHTNLADCHYGLGLVLDEKGDYESSLEWHQKSIDIKKQTLEEDDSSIGYSYNSIANVYQKKKAYKLALEYYTKALNIWNKTFGDNHPDVAMCLNNMGCLYENEKKYSEAIECYEKALAIKNNNLPNNHINISATHNNLGSVYGNIGQFDLALKHFNISLDIKSKALPTNHPDVASTLKNIGLIYEIKRDFVQAKSYYEQVANIRRQILPSTHPDVIKIEEIIRRVSLNIN